MDRIRNPSKPRDSVPRQKLPKTHSPIPLNCHCHCRNVTVSCHNTLDGTTKKISYRPFTSYAFCFNDDHLVYEPVDTRGRRRGSERGARSLHIKRLLTLSNRSFLHVHYSRSVLASSICLGTPSPISLDLIYSTPDFTRSSHAVWHFTRQGKFSSLKHFSFQSVGSRVFSRRTVALFSSRTHINTARSMKTHNIANMSSAANRNARHTDTQP